MLFVLCALCSDADEPVADGKLAVLCSSQCIRIYDPERIVRTCTIDSVYFRYYNCVKYFFEARYCIDYI